MAFMKVKNDAMLRKLWQPTSVVEEFKVRTKVKQVANDPGDSLWESTNGIRLLKLLWKCGRATGQTNTDYVCWTYRYKQNPDSYLWNVGGARGANIDVVDTVLDSLHQSRNNTVVGTVLTWNIPAQFTQRMMGDTLNNHGWAWHNFGNNQNGQINDAEIIYYSADESVINNRPQIRVRLASSSGIMMRRRVAIVGTGLIGK
jgi:DNA-binding ferritin-like protein (Dps family)